MVHLICGKICSGKTVYAKRLARQSNGVILSCDEVTYALFENNLGQRHDEVTAKIRAYLLKKAVEISQAGTDVILDWGFWTAQYRAEVTAYLENAGVPIRWHYIAVSDARWQSNITCRNAEVLAGTSTDYYVDDGLLAKLNTRFEAPERSQMDVWYDE